MELITPEEFIVEDVIDLDFAFQFGQVVQHTLRTKTDSYEQRADQFVLRFGNGEVITIFTHNLGWVSRRERQIKTPVKKEPPKDLAAPINQP